jgi:hypothetical protein
MLNIRKTIVALALSAAWPLALSAADGGWSMPNLNLFGGKGKPPTSSRAANPPTSGWHMPKLLPGNTTTKKKPNPPSAWQKMNSSTQSFFSKTAGALNPWDDKKTPAPAQKITGSNTAFTHNNAAKPETKSGSILPAAWWSGDKKDQSPKSVNDFLAQPRPH